MCLGIVFSGSEKALNFASLDPNLVIELALMKALEPNKNYCVKFRLNMLCILFAHLE